MNRAVLREFGVRWDQRRSALVRHGPASSYLSPHPDFLVPLLNSRSEQLGALTIRHAVPTIYQLRTFAADGGLMSYGGSLTDAYTLVGVYTGRILKGEKPSDLPVQQATKVELIVNLKTAKALGLTIPESILGRADEVIE